MYPVNSNNVINAISIIIVDSFDAFDILIVLRRHDNEAQFRD